MTAKELWTVIIAGVIVVCISWWLGDVPDPTQQQLERYEMRKQKLTGGDPMFGQSFPRAVQQEGVIVSGCSFFCGDVIYDFTFSSSDTTTAWIQSTDAGEGEDEYEILFSYHDHPIGFSGGMSHGSYPM